MSASPPAEASPSAGPVEVVDAEASAAASAETSVEAQPPTEGFEYGDDVGKGFENQEPLPSPEAKA